MTRLMTDNPTISAHISLFAQSERNGTLARRTAGAPVRIEYIKQRNIYLQLHMLGYKDVVHVHM